MRGSSSLICEGTAVLTSINKSIDKEMRSPLLYNRRTVWSITYCSCNSVLPYVYATLAQRVWSRAIKDLPVTHTSMEEPRLLTLARLYFQPPTRLYGPDVQFRDPTNMNKVFLCDVSSAQVFDQGTCCQGAKNCCWSQVRHCTGLRTKTLKRRKPPPVVEVLVPSLMINFIYLRRTIYVKPCVY